VVAAHALEIKNILVPVAGTDDDQVALDLAIDLARRASAHVEVLHTRADPKSVIPFVGEGGSAAMVQDMIDSAARDAEQRAARARLAFDSAAAGLPVTDEPGTADGASVDWHEATGREAHWVVRRGRLADLVVAARPTDPDDIEQAVMLEAALFDSGRAVLLAPPQLPAQTGTKVAIAWNGSAQAARAVGEAMPFLRAAEEVIVLTVEEGGELPDDPEALAASLAWRGVPATVHSVKSADGGTGATVLDEAQRLGCDLVVMGAYGHSRLREMVLGGATRQALTATALPILMSH